MTTTNDDDDDDNELESFLIANATLSNLSTHQLAAPIMKMRYKVSNQNYSLQKDQRAT